ncbi:MAG: DMT family transporter [Marmoricola sp.]
MTTGPAVGAALGASAAAAVAANLQHKAASRGRSDEPTSTGQLTRFVRHQLAQRLWWGALVAQAASLVLHATALRLGSLSLVQPMLATVVVLALPLNHRMSHSRITRAELFWAGLMTVCLAGFLVAAAPRASGSPITTGRLALPGIAAAVVVAVCVLLARSGSARVAALALGTASGIAFSLEAALLRLVAGTLLHAPLTTLADPGLYGLVVAGVAGVALTQLAYRAGPISSALPAIITVNFAASIVLGVLFGGDQLRTSPGAVAVEVASFAGLALSLAALARFHEAVSPVDAHLSTPT